MGSIVDRLEQIRQEKNLKKIEFAKALGISNAHYAQVLSGRNKISAEHLGNLYEYFKGEVDLGWILSGQMQPDIKLIIDNNDQAQEIDTSNVSEKYVEELYHLIRKEKASLALDYKQELKLKLACKKIIAENPGVGLKELVIAGRVFLNHLLQFPDLEI